MFTHLLVPLDGSALAEAVLPAAVHLAQQLHARITLLHVTEHNPPDAVHGQRHITAVAEGADYLAAIAKTLPGDLHVEAHVHPNEEHNVARSIVQHAEELGVDLIAMCTHGRGSVKRLLFGTIAQKVLALGETPVLLVSPEAAASQAEQPGGRYTCQQILAPLDGDAEHEAGLTVAIAVAQACSAALHLVMVVPTPGTLKGEQSATAILLPTTTAAVLDISQQSAAEYLQRQARLVTEQGVTVSTGVRRGEPAAMIADAAQAAHADLIVMATHGKSHTDAFWSGSVSPRVSGRAQRPLLLVPVGDADVK